MINNSIESLFEAIQNSSFYQEYIKMVKIISQDDNIKELIDEIKELEKQATYLESIGDNKYKEIDNVIKEKADLLNENHIYQEYLNRMEELNNELAISSKMIEDYIAEKV